MSTAVDYHPPLTDSAHSCLSFITLMTVQLPSATIHYIVSGIYERTVTTSLYTNGHTVLERFHAAVQGAGVSSESDRARQSKVTGGVCFFLN